MSPSLTIKSQMRLALTLRVYQLLRSCNARTFDYRQMTTSKCGPSRCYAAISCYAPETWTQFGYRQISRIKIKRLSKQTCWSLIFILSLGLLVVCVIIKIALNKDYRCSFVAGTRGKVTKGTDKVSKLSWSCTL